MARVTVEDCVQRVPNRFELVMLSAQRARQIAGGAPLTVPKDNDKNPVIALREIADGTISLEDLGNNLVQTLQKHVEIDEPEEEGTEFRMPASGELPAGQSEVLGGAGASAGREEEADSEADSGSEESDESDGETSGQLYEDEEVED